MKKNGDKIWSTISCVYTEIKVRKILILLNFFVHCNANNLTHPEEKHQKIQIESQSRDYRSGPVGGSYLMTVHDQMVMTLDYPGDDYIWVWGMIAEKTKTWCDQTTIYGHGEKVSMVCPKAPGIYRVYADRLYIKGDSLDHGVKLELNAYVKSGALLCEDHESCSKHFQLLDRTLADGGSTFGFDHISSRANMVQSDPIKITPSEHCFIWAYEVEEIERVGYVFTEPEPTGNEGSFILYSLKAWITEPNSMSEEELHHKLPQTAYSKVITRRFYSKGLEPCLRYSHQTIELVSDTPEYTNEADSLGLYWTIKFKIHTNTIIATLSDIVFTVASRQHIALYDCFVAETRVMIDARQFTFLQPQRNEMQSINMIRSDMPTVLKEYIRTRMKHMYGHFIQHVGRPWYYESSEHRRDLQLFQNPCMSLEFCFSIKGVAYLAQNWLSEDVDDIAQISVPGLQDLDSFLDDQDQMSREDKDNKVKYVKAYDLTITPTHIVILTDNSNIFLHPTSVIYKGFGFIRNVQSYRPGALVTRRWCATTGYTEHNMIVPAYSANGNFIIIQIVPNEEPRSMWIKAPTAACLQKPKEVKEPEENGNNEKKEEEDTSLAKDEEELYSKMIEDRDKLECCIHRHEIRKVKSKLTSDNLDKKCSDSECEILIPSKRNKTDTEGAEILDGDEDYEEDDDQSLDAKKKFWMSGSTLLQESDPHFPDATNDFHFAEDKKTTTKFNQHMLYEVDRRGKLIQETFAMSGIDLMSKKTKFNSREFFWVQDVQFTAVERKFMLAVEFKSVNIKQTSFSLSMVSAVTQIPIRIPGSKEKVILTSSYDFSGVLIVRPVTAKEPISNDRLDGRVLTYTTNTALSCYVIHIDHRRFLNSSESQDVMIYATADATHARPLSYYMEGPTKGNEMGTIRVRFAGQHSQLKNNTQGVLKADMIMTQHGVISVLLRKANVTANDEAEERDFYPQIVMLGSVIVPEPLRKIKPFKGTTYAFQRTTTDGEIVYGSYVLDKWKESKNETIWRPTTESVGKTTMEPENSTTSENDTTTDSTTGASSNKRMFKFDTDFGAPRVHEFVPSLIDAQATKFLATPYESLMVASAGPMIAELEGDEDVDDSSVEENCPFSDFVVHQIPLDFAEVEYRTRVTAELTFLGATIPLEADLIVEFDDNHGIAAVIRSSIEESKDQTVVRKTIDIYTFLTPSSLADMYEYAENHHDEDEVKEDNTLFSLTIRPSIVNLNCHRSLFFKTIQVNVGCNPFTSMRFIAEALNLPKPEIKRSNSYKDRQNFWTVTRNGEELEVTIPRSKINFGQRKMFDCKSETTPKEGYCIIPKKYTKLVKENIYQLHFSKSVVPKFEQFLTSHVRRVTANVFLYNLFGGEMEPNTTLLQSGCHNIAAHCLPDDLSCGSFTNRSSNLQTHPWTNHFFDKLATHDHHTHIYRHFKDCYSPYRETSYLEKLPVERALPSKMEQEKYWIFNNTNFNSFKVNKHRNMIFVIRAVVLNTPDNGFTYCQRLETFFLLHIVGVSPARQPLRWQYYLALITFVLFIFVLIYFYFARSSRWQSQVTIRRVREVEDKQQREMEAKQFKDGADSNVEPVSQWAQRLRATARNSKVEKVGSEPKPNTPPVVDPNLDSNLT